MKPAKINFITMTCAAMALCAASGCRSADKSVPANSIAPRGVVAQVLTPPTPAQRCSSKATYRDVIEAINASFTSTPTLTRPITSEDFALPMVENVNRDAMAIDCSARLHVPAPPHHPSCGAANYAFLDQGVIEGAGFAFRVQYRLHDAADGSGTTIELPQSNHINYAMTDCTGR